MNTISQLRMMMMLGSMVLVSACGGGGSSSGGGTDVERPQTVPQCLTTQDIGSTRRRFTNTCNFIINVNVFSDSGITALQLQANQTVEDQQLPNATIVACQAPAIPGTGANGGFCTAG